MSKVQIIAEAGVNHNGDINIAKQLIKVASEAGADLVKFQTFQASKGLSKNAPKAEYQLQSTDSSEYPILLLPAHFWAPPSRLF